MTTTLTAAFCAALVLLQVSSTAQQPVAHTTTTPAIEEQVAGFSGKVDLVRGQLAPTSLTVFDRGKSAATSKPIKVEVKPDGSFSSQFPLPRLFTMHNYTCVKVGELRVGIGDKARPISVVPAGIDSTTTSLSAHIGNAGFTYATQQSFTGDLKSISAGLGASLAGGGITGNLGINKLAGGVVMACPADAPQGEGVPQ